MEMVNGYVFLDLTKANVYSKALKVLGTDKPVVIKDGSGSPYFVDSLTLDGTNIIITKGGKTITIANDNTITSVGDISTIMENIVDSNGNKRFIEFDGTVNEITGVTYTYIKASLSGTHLMFVLGCDITNTSVIANSQPIVTFKLPEYILDKIAILFGTDAVMFNSELAIADDSSNQSFNVTLNKISDGVEIRKFSTLTLNADRHVRVQFDLLIDTE